MRKKLDFVSVINWKESWWNFSAPEGFILSAGYCLIHKMIGGVLWTPPDRYKSTTGDHSLIYLGVALSPLWNFDLCLDRWILLSLPTPPANIFKPHKVAYLQLMPFSVINLKKIVCANTDTVFTNMCHLIHTCPVRNTWATKIFVQLFWTERELFNSMGKKISP